MPLVVTALDAALDLPAPAAGDAEPPPTVLGRALKRVGAVAEADARNVSRAQIEVRLVSDRVGAGCRVTALGENPTPWFPSESGLGATKDGAPLPAKRLLRKGESAVLRDGDGLGLCQTDVPPGRLRFQSARAARTLGPEALFDAGANAHASDDARERHARTTRTTTVIAPPRPSIGGAVREATARANEAATPPRGAKRARDARDTPIAPIATAPNPDPDPKPIVLVLSGAPGSGKSTFCAALPRESWVVVNQDTAGRGGKRGTRAQCAEATRRALATSTNVAVDRCGLTPEQRETFVRLAAAHGADAHALWLDLPRDTLFERLRRRRNHPTIADGGGVGVCKRMLGAKANAPPSKKEGFAVVTRCVNAREIERALAGYRGGKVTTAGVGGVGAFRGFGVVAAGDADSTSPARDVSAAAPNAFDAMMFDAKASARSREKNAAPCASEPPKRGSPAVARPALGGGGFRRDALSAMAADPAAFQTRGAVLFFDDELVVARDAYPKSETHVLVLARDPRLAPGPVAMRSTDAPLVRRMMRAGVERARTLAASASAGDEKDADASDEKDERFRFRCGFHAAPSMRTAHMHVVSGDLRGSGMKTRRHWNSFATSFFREAEETARDLERLLDAGTGDENAENAIWDVAELERVVALTPLRCHKCGDGPFATMPKLFAHVDACARPGFSTRTDAL